MKKIILPFAVISYAFCNAQESAHESVVSTSHGTFSSVMLSSPETKSGNGPGAETKELKFEQSEKKTRDGGTSTLVRFNPKSKEAVKLEANKTEEEALKVSVYPNPAKGIINVAIGDGRGKTYDDTYTVRLRNLVGQSLYEQQFNEKLLRIDSSTLPKGFYLVEVTTAEGKAAGVQKLVVQ